jgi:hypothetical protein
MKFTAKEWTLVIIAVALLAVYAVFFSDWFKARTLRISHSVRPPRTARSQAPAPSPVITFGLDQSARLTEIKVYSVNDMQTNRHPVALWYLVSDSNSVPVRSFIYGQRVRGMHPIVPGASAMPLETNQLYRLFISAGKLKGQHDFQPGLVMPPAR